MMIDNFDEIRSHLTFETKFDRYIVHIIKRAKDDDGKKYGVSEGNRLLKSFYISSLEYYDYKIPVIKDMCESFGARAYILPQVRDNSACMRELLKIVVDNFDNPTISPNHLVKKAYCGYHGSRDKKWIIDLDDDNMTEYIVHSKYGGTDYEKKEYTAEDVLEFVKKQLVNVGKSEKDAYMIPTVHGHCIVTSTFDLKKAYDECNMMFHGEQKKTIDWTWTGPDEGRAVEKKLNGWLIKDGMALLYFNGDSKDKSCT